MQRLKSAGSSPAMIFGFSLNWRRISSTNSPAVWLTPRMRRAEKTYGTIAPRIRPAIIAVVTPLAFGLIFGRYALGGFLIGGLLSAIQLAIFCGNAGGAMDNAKKYIEEGHYGGKGSEAHDSSVVGDTVGDPLKDTVGPSLDILIKLMSVVALVFASLFPVYPIWGG